MEGNEKAAETGQKSPKMSKASSWTETSVCWAMAAERRPTMVLHTEATRDSEVRGSS